MNMNDLKVLAAQKAEMSAVEFQNLPPDQEQEDSPELKTPTAESNGIMVPEVQKAGSGLPYSNTAAITHSHIVSPKSHQCTKALCHYYFCSHQLVYWHYFFYFFLGHSSQ